MMEELIDSNKEFTKSKRIFWITLTISISGVLYWHINNFDLIHFIYDSLFAVGKSSNNIFEEFIPLIIITIACWINFIVFIWFYSKNKSIKFFLWSSIAILIVMIIYSRIQFQTSFYISDIVVGGEMNL